MPGWMVEPPDEAEEREREAKTEAQKAILDSQATDMARERQFWAKEIFVFTELYNLSLAGQPCFNHMLISLILKADSERTANLAQGFPIAVRMVREWRDSAPWDFYIANDIRPLLHGGSANHYDRHMGIEAEEAVAEAEAILDGEMDYANDKAPG